MSSPRYIHRHHKHRHHDGEHCCFNEVADHYIDYVCDAPGEHFKLFKKGGLKNALKNIIHGVGQGLKKVGQAASFAVVLPFKDAMKHGLDAKGLSHSNKIEDISTKFFHSHVKGQGFMDKYDEYFIPSHFDESRYNIVDEAASAIIGAIVDYFKNLKKKKDSGQPLTPDEEKMLAKSEAAQTALVNKAKDMGEEAAASKVKDFLFSWKGAVAGAGILGLIVAVIYLAGRAKRPAHA